MKIFVCTVLIAVLVAVSGQGYPRPSYNQAPPAYSAPAYSKPSYQPAYPSAYPKAYDTPMPYNFAWAVKDQPSYNDYAHQETADGKGYVSGSYNVNLPDGRTQIVNYKADDYTGYVADVTYVGEAKYPSESYKPSSYKPAYPEYKPAYPAQYPPRY
ncbi:hypothetical protein DAPPUDRAFT_111503 [Daphnia pulex]|uniref:Cuticle protein n=1 Tax=Daphnia pulex TaxID=6669 RepID=E9H9F3_DAPPU|nr:hypothetical protein DAPPUDRAFT_111503 [Daphnia pulex]|eukprot:EFX71664.1 hypothetical protein DAPPUDRAFT_111503 [Daphnia pulex]